ncbi:O-antigen ligase family protein [Parabacteroides sp. OttesenSCG-928-G07]|nr:O-antigen ligase family protein [Parabacteroides sp. OttesenSCG-928-G07]
MNICRDNMNYGVPLPVIGIVLLLFTVFANNSQLANGLVMGQVFWFHISMLFLTLVVFFYGIFVRQEYLHIHLPDILILLFYGITLFTYDWELNPEPEKLLFGGQLVVLWFILRILIRRYPFFRLLLLVLILCIGFIEAIHGMEQLYGYRMSNHGRFRLTGSFYNPGPYSGFLAIILPIALDVVLRIGTLKKKPWWHFTTVLYYTAWMCLIGILLVLPAGMSRSAWLAALISCGWVYWLRRIGWRKTRTIAQGYKRLFLIGSTLCLVGLIIGIYGLYQLKKDSADGRLLMSKITAQAILDRPVTGAGLGGFPAAFAEEQARYFSSGKASPTEQFVAGAPEYAFNEYLQIGLEQGIPGLIVFLLVIGYCFFSGIKNRRIGAAGGILAFAVFATTSYPLQIPSFWIILISLGVVCVAEPCSFSFGKKFSLKMDTFYLSIVTLVICFMLVYPQKGRYIAYKAWSTAKMYYTNKAYETAVPGYEDLYAQLNHKPEYLFEYAQSLSNTGHYQEANELLSRATRLSADPMIWYVMGRNEQALGNYKEAESHIEYGLDILPERIYPYYLLAKLYAESGYFDPKKLDAAIDSVLTKEPKVHTTAIREMRDEVRKLRDSRSQRSENNILNHLDF